MVRRGYSFITNAFTRMRYRFLTVNAGKSVAENAPAACVSGPP